MLHDVACDANVVDALLMIRVCPGKSLELCDDADDSLAPLIEDDRVPSVRDGDENE